MIGAATEDRKAVEIARRVSGPGRCSTSAREAGDDPEVLKRAPTNAVVGRLDEVKAAKRVVVRYGFEDHPDLSDEPMK